MASSSVSRGVRGILVAMVVGGYGWLLITAARWLGRVLFSGWSARLTAMAVVAAGVLPWRGWLNPRMRHAIGAGGRAALVGCYLLLFAPMAALARWRHRAERGSPGQQPSSRWRHRPPLRSALEDAAREWSCTS